MNYLEFGKNNPTLCPQYSLLEAPFNTEHPEEACPTKCSNSLLGIPAFDEDDDDDDVCCASWILLNVVMVISSYMYVHTSCVLWVGMRSKHRSGEKKKIFIFIFTCICICIFIICGIEIEMCVCILLPRPSSSSLVVGT